MYCYKSDRSDRVERLCWAALLAQICPTLSELGVRDETPRVARGGHEGNRCCSRWKVAWLAIDATAGSCAKRCKPRHQNGGLHFSRGSATVDLLRLNKGTFDQYLTLLVHSVRKQRITVAINSNFRWNSDKDYAISFSCAAYLETLHHAVLSPFIGSPLAFWEALGEGRWCKILCLQRSRYL